jgi:hypothetical protein
VPLIPAVSRLAWLPRRRSFWLFSSVYWSSAPPRCRGSSMIGPLLSVALPPESSNKREILTKPVKILSSGGGGRLRIATAAQSQPDRIQLHRQGHGCRPLAGRRPSLQASTASTSIERHVGILVDLRSRRPRIRPKPSSRAPALVRRCMSDFHLLAAAATVGSIVLTNRIRILGSRDERGAFSAI